MHFTLQLRLTCGWIRQPPPSWWVVVTMSWVQDALPSSLTWHKMFSCSGVLASYFVYWNLSLGETAAYPLVPFPPASIVVGHWAGPVASQNKYYISQLFLSRCDPGIKFWLMGQVVSGSSIWKSSLSFFWLLPFPQYGDKMAAAREAVPRPEVALRLELMRGKAQDRGTLNPWICAQKTYHWNAHSLISSVEKNKLLDYLVILI